MIADTAARLNHEKNGLLNDNLSLEQLYQRTRNSSECYIYITPELKIEELQQKLIPEAMQGKSQESAPDASGQRLTSIPGPPLKEETRLEINASNDDSTSATNCFDSKYEPNIGRKKLQSSITTTIPL